MARFVWYIVDCDNATVSGTNDLDIVQDLISQAADNIVLIHKDSGVFYSAALDEEDIPEYGQGEEEDDPDEDD